MEKRDSFGTAKDRQVFRLRKCHHDIVEAEKEKWPMLPTSESVDPVGAIHIAGKGLIKKKIIIFSKMKKENKV